MFECNTFAHSGGSHYGHSHMPDALMLDFNGTLSIDEHLWFAAYASVFAEAGRPLPRVTWDARFVGRSDARIVEEWLGPAVDTERVIRAAMEAFRAANADGAAIPQAARDAVRSAAARVPVAVVSAALTEVIEDGLSAAGIREHITTIVSAEDVRAVKPDPEAYLLALERLGVAASEAVAVEDTPVGVTAALSAGLRCVAVLGTVPAERLRDAERRFDRLGPELVTAVLGPR